MAPLSAAEAGVVGGRGVLHPGWNRAPTTPPSSSSSSSVVAARRVLDVPEEVGVVSGCGLGWGGVEGVLRFIVERTVKGRILGLLG